MLAGMRLAWPIAREPEIRQHAERVALLSDEAVAADEALRVVDASVMPAIPRANTNLTCIMIAERVAAWMQTEAGAAPSRASAAVSAGGDERRADVEQALRYAAA